MQTIKVKNPILRGFNPDPNILRVKERYYIIVSSFEWLPGIRVYESKNLVNWSHTTDILTTQVSLQGNPQMEVYGRHRSVMLMDCFILFTQMSKVQAVRLKMSTII